MPLFVPFGWQCDVRVPSCCRHQYMRWSRFACLLPRFRVSYPNRWVSRKTHRAKQHFHRACCLGWHCRSVLGGSSRHVVAFLVPQQEIIVVCVTVRVVAGVPYVVVSGSGAIAALLLFPSFPGKSPVGEMQGEHAVGCPLKTCTLSFPAPNCLLLGSPLWCLQGGEETSPA